MCVQRSWTTLAGVSPVTVIASEEYIDYNLVMATTFGNPIGTGVIRGQLIVKCGSGRGTFYVRKDAMGNENLPQ